MAFQSYNSRVPSLHAFGDSNNTGGGYDRSGGRMTGLESMPIKKRYTKSHFGANGFEGYNPSSPTYPATEYNFNSSAPSSGYSSSEENKDNESPLDFSAPRNVIRAGVIRHSSKPQACLAYYFLEK